MGIRGISLDPAQLVYLVGLASWGFVKKIRPNRSSIRITLEIFQPDLGLLGIWWDFRQSA